MTGRLEDDRNWLERNRVRLAIAVVAVIAVGAVAYLLYPSDACAPGVTRMGGECVGVTDGAFAFDPDLAGVEGDIQHQDESIAGTRYVTVAFLGPLTSNASRGLTAGRIRDEMEGIFVGQLEANAGNLVGDYPHIRLILANEGSDEQEWPYVVHELEKETGPPDRLVAVAGVGLSQSQTVAAARDLAAHHIAMVGDVDTGDGIDTTGSATPGGPIYGLARVDPSNAVEVRALATYLADRPDLRTAMLVTDRGDTNDLYAATLDHDFRSELGGYLKAGGDIIEPFGSGSQTAGPHDPGLGNQFQTIASDLCGSDAPDMVFYAGREVYLPTFLAYVRQRPCWERKLTIVTGSDAFAMPVSAQQAPVSLIYPALAYLPELEGKQNPYRPQFENFQRVFDAHFSDSGLNDDWSLMGNDAMLTVAKAIRLATGSPAQPLPAPGTVADLLYNLNESSSVPGATGDIALDENGEPAHPVLPILETTPSGKRTLVDVYSP